MNKFSDQRLGRLRQQFLRAMRVAFDIFGTHAFRKRYSSQASRLPINKALFEAWSTNLDHLNDEQIEYLINRKGAVQESFIKLMNEDRDFENSISLSTGSSRKIEYRFQAIEKLIGEVLHAPHTTSP